MKRTDPFSTRRSNLPILVNLFTWIFLTGHTAFAYNTSEAHPLSADKYKPTTNVPANVIHRPLVQPKQIKRALKKNKHTSIGPVDKTYPSFMGQKHLPWWSKKPKQITNRTANAMQLPHLPPLSYKKRLTPSLKKHQQKLYPSVLPVNRSPRYKKWLLDTYSTSIKKAFTTPPVVAFPSFTPLNAFLGRYLGSLSIGPILGKGGRTQTFYLQEGIEKTYSSQPQRRDLTEVEVFAGFQKQWFSSPLLSQFGLAVSTATAMPLQGEIWEDADPEFNNFIYNYKLEHTLLAFKGKVFSSGLFMSPYLSGSVGIGFNTARTFTITPRIPEEVPAPPFKHRTKTAFSYTLGIGLQKEINNNWQWGIGYEYSDWGKSQLARADGQTLNSGLSLSHLRTNGLLINITYLPTFS